MVVGEVCTESEEDMEEKRRRRIAIRSQQELELSEKERRVVSCLKGMKVVEENGAGSRCRCSL